MMKLSATLIAGLSTYVVAIFLPVVSGSSTYLRDPRANPCAQRTCQSDSDCCPSNGFTCNLNTNKCEYPLCISDASRGCDQDSSNVALHCCSGWKCIEHPTGQYLGYCVKDIITPNSSSSNSVNNRNGGGGVNPNAARNPNNCAIPSYEQTCPNMSMLTICCNNQSTWYSCDGQCYNDDNDAAIIEE